MQNTKHGILKSSSHRNQEHHIKWDEQTLKAHDRSRGGYIKINQPKTPYHQMELEPQDMIKLQQISKEQQQVEYHLKEANANRDKNKLQKLDLKKLNEELLKQLKESGNMSEESDPQDKQIQRRKQQFNKKRNQHYSGEFKKHNPLSKKNNDWQEEDD